MVKSLGVIPARFKSTRFEGKVIAELSGKPLVQWVWEAAQESSTLEKVVIATDDERVERVCREFGAEVVRTSPEHSSGTDRIFEVLNTHSARIIVNIQADEPLIRGAMIDDLVMALEEGEDVEVATLIKEIDSPEEINSSDVVKVVVDRHFFALYFSRCPIPFCREENCGVVYYKHIGMYAYGEEFLYTFKNLPESRLEKAEKLEQLRILEAGFRIKTALTTFDTISVDTPQDLEKAEEFLKGLGHS